MYIVHAITNQFGMKAVNELYIIKNINNIVNNVIFGPLEYNVQSWWPDYNVVYNKTYQLLWNQKTLDLALDKSYTTVWKLESGINQYCSQIKFMK